MTRTPRSLTAVVTAPVALCALLVAGPAWSARIFEDLVITSAPVLDQDPSMRSTAMGGASTAVLFGTSRNPWANPALLGFARGVEHEQSDVQLIPESLPDAWFRSRRTTLGHGGVGVAVSGLPFESLGGSSLAYGGMGGLLAFPARERARSWGAGVSAAGVLRTISALRGRDAPVLARHVDVALGIAQKRVENTTVDPENPAGVTAWDWGLVLRGALPIRALGWPAPGRLQAAYGHAVLNSNDAELLGTPTARHHRNGLALDAAFDVPHAWAQRLPRWFAPGVGPLLSVGAAFDAVHQTDGSPRESGIDRRHWGVEAGLAGVLFVRAGGSRADPGGEAHHTWGLGARVPLGHWAAASYDYARESWGGDLGVTRRPRGWSVWIDPLAIYHDAR